MRIYSEAWRRGWEWAKLKVVISDGAVWIWKPAALGLPDLSLLCRAPGGRARHRSGDERLIPSRDRKGADACVASILFRDEQSHGLALIVDYVLKSVPYILVLP